MNTLRFTAFSLALLGLSISGCGTSSALKEKDAATTTPKALIQNIAEVGSGIRLGKPASPIGKNEFQTKNFNVYQTHYWSQGMDIWAIDDFKKLCTSQGGIFPEKTFNAKNPHILGRAVVNNRSATGSYVPETTFPTRMDCVSLSTGRLMYSFFYATGPTFTFENGLGGSPVLNYVIFSVITPKNNEDIDPTKELIVISREPWVKIPIEYNTRINALTNQ
jgi:hypothetical protein